jgi:hypothetical protein
MNISFSWRSSFFAESINSSHQVKLTLFVETDGKAQIMNMSHASCHHSLASVGPTKGAGSACGIYYSTTNSSISPICPPTFNASSLISSPGTASILNNLTSFESHEVPFATSGYSSTKILTILLGSSTHGSYSRHRCYIICSNTIGIFKFFIVRFVAISAVIIDIVTGPVSIFNNLTTISGSHEVPAMAGNNSSSVHQFARKPALVPMAPFSSAAFSSVATTFQQIVCSVYRPRRKWTRQFRPP